MPDVNCSVQSCAHNKNGSCYATAMNITGNSATNSVGTCCGSYLDNVSYSNIANLVSDNRPVNYVLCSAENCKFNYNGGCSRDQIDVTRNSTMNFDTDTECADFELN